MTATSKPVALSNHPRPAARQNSYRAYRAEAVRLVAVARDSGLRFQRQWVIVFIFGMLALATVASMYLNVTASAAIAGREIQNIEAEITVIERTNADLQTNIATLLSNKTLAERALAMNFKPVERAMLEYVLVPGYMPAQAVTMVVPAAQPEMVSNLPEFNETLIDWVKQQMEMASIPLIQVNH